MEVLATISSGDDRPIIETAEDPNLHVLLWIWKKGPNPYVKRERTLRCAGAMVARIIRVNTGVAVYDSTPLH